MPDPNAPVMKVAVFVDGRLTADGQPVTIEQLRESFRNLSSSHGAVWYYRESANQEPPPIAMEVLKEIVAARLPVRLSSKPDYSDAIVPGKPK